MLYRKRAWDIMRSEFPVVDHQATLTQVIQAMEGSLETAPDNNCVLVTSRQDGFLGIISMWNIIRAMGPGLLKKAGQTSQDENYENSFKLACQLGAQAGITKIIQKDVPRISPNETLARIMEVFLDYRQGRLVVEEGGKVMGLVMLSDLYREIASCI